MARIGKIARLPRAVRAQLNSRLQDGAEGKQIVQWLNSLSEVKQLLADKFDGRPISEQNLSDWRQGGYEDWLAHQAITAQAAELAANQQELAAVLPGQSLPDHLAAAVSFRYAAILAAQGLELDEPALCQLKALGRIGQAVVKLRRSDQNAARLKIETERWERVREQMDSDRADTLKRRQREALAAPVWGALKKGERFVQFGGGKSAQMAVDLLDEIETCPDPAHFQSKVLASLSLPELRRDVQEKAKHPPVVPTPVQAAAEMLKEIDAYLAKTDGKYPAVKLPSEPRRRARKSAPCRKAKRAATRRVRRAKPVQPDPEPSAAPSPGGPEGVASSLRLEPSLSAPTPPAGAEPPIGSDRV